ncbi:MAG: DNA gyrase subunit A, partial [Atopobiaceae bacterium]|nr:DNA gyrase subunit A [Atopobiaceae bacterium]
VRPMGRDTTGVRGITLKDDATMLGMEITNGKGDLFVITENGYGKRTPVAEYPEHKRGGQGVFTITMTKRKGALVGMRVIGPQHELMIVSAEGVVIRVKAKDISKLGRSTQGVKVMNVAGGDSVKSLARMVVKKAVPKPKDENQGALDLAAAGAADADDEEPVDIGGDEDLDDTLIDDEDE